MSISLSGRSTIPPGPILNGTGSILAAKPAPPEPSALRAKFTKATKAGRTKLLGTDSGTARKIAAVAVLTDRGNCQSLYLVQLTDTTDGNHVYVATKSNDPAKPIPIVLPEDLFNDAAVVVPKALFTDADITAATDRGYVLFDSFTKTSRPDLASLIPSSAGSDEEHFVVVGPKCLALVYGDFGYHGAADDSARSALEASQGSSVTKLFLAMKEHFNLNTQQWLVTNSASVPDEFFKKPHGTRPLVDNSFAVPVTGPGEDVGDDELEELSSAIRAHLPLPQIPRKIDPTRTLGLDDDDDTLASVTQGGLTERESRVWLNLVAVDPDSGTPCMPVATKTGTHILSIKSDKEFLQSYRSATGQLETSWTSNPELPFYLCHIEFPSTTLAGVAVTANFLTNDTPIVDFSVVSRLKTYDDHLNIPLPTGSPLATHEFGANQTLEELMGEPNENRTKQSLAMPSVQSLGSIDDARTMVSNSIARCGIYAEVTGPIVPIRVELYKQIQSVLMRKEVKKWFKQEDHNYPWVKYSIITLLSYINVTIGNGAKDPDNKMALATDIAKYSPVVIKRVRKQVELWETKLLAAIAGDEPPITKLYKSTSAYKDAKAKKAAAQAAGDAQRRQAADQARQRDAAREAARLARQTPPGPPTSLSDLPAGDLLFPGTNMLCPKPTITDPAEQPCMAGLRFGKACRNQGCPYSHKSINELSAPSQAEWKAHVLSHPQLFFNSKSVTCFPAEPGLYAEPAQVHASKGGKRKRSQ